MRIMCVLFFVIFFNQAHAASATYKYSYTLQSNEVLSGQLVGELQSDLDKINASSIISASYSGLPGTDLSTNQTGGWVTISGSNMNLGVSFSDAENGIGWGILTGNLTGVAYGAGGIFDLENFDASRWSIQEVPLPAAAWLFLSAIGGLGVLKRFRK